MSAIHANGSRLTPSEDQTSRLSAVRLAQAIAEGRCTASDATSTHLGRIRALDRDGPNLAAVIETNARAMDIAAELDARRDRAGPLHGVPVLVKANVDTADAMATSAGALALAGHRARQDAPLVARLRTAGAVLIGKTNLSEWAFFRSAEGISGWSSLGGQTRNPYALDRSPSGSSSGAAVAVAAGLAPLAIGTETDGSIVSPASVNGVVGIKPTPGVVDAQGIIPIAKSLDTAGPLARNVRDAALLAAIANPGVLPAFWPPAAVGSKPLRGIRIGILRGFRVPDWPRALESAIAAARDLGAEAVDPVRLNIDPDWRDAELQLMLHEFKAGLNAYLQEHETPIEDLAGLIAYNDAHAEAVMPTFGQDLLIAAEATLGLDTASYATARARGIGAMRRSLARVFEAHSLDALMVPADGPAPRIGEKEPDAVGSSSVAALGGCPSIALPWALIDGLPVGIALIGKPFAEASLVALAAACEDARGAFPAPTAHIAGQSPEPPARNTSSRSSGMEVSEVPRNR